MTKYAEKETAAPTKYVLLMRLFLRLQVINSIGNEDYTSFKFSLFRSKEVKNRFRTNEFFRSTEFFAVKRFFLRRAKLHSTYGREIGTFIFFRCIEVMSSTEVRSKEVRLYKEENVGDTNYIANSLLQIDVANPM